MKIKKGVAFRLFLFRHIVNITPHKLFNIHPVVRAPFSVQNIPVATNIRRYCAFPSRSIFTHASESATYVVSVGTYILYTSCPVFVHTKFASSASNCTGYFNEMEMRLSDITVLTSVVPCLTVYLM